MFPRFSPSLSLPEPVAKPDASYQRQQVKYLFRFTIPRTNLGLVRLFMSKLQGKQIVSVMLGACNSSLLIQKMPATGSRIIFN